jgi:hypothetical protein
VVGGLGTEMAATELLSCVSPFSSSCRIQKVPASAKNSLLLAPYREGVPKAVRRTSLSLLLNANAISAASYTDLHFAPQTAILHVGCALQTSAQVFQFSCKEACDTRTAVTHLNISQAPTES